MPSSGSHEEFVQLCALSTSGELSDEEWIRLEQHLLECPSCRERKRQYESVVSNLLPALAEASDRSRSAEDDPATWSIESAEASLMSALDRRHSASEPGTARNISSFSRRWPYLVAATVLLCGGTILGLFLGRARREPKTSTPIQTATYAAPPAHPANADIDLLRQKVEQKDRELARLQANLSDRNSTINRMKAERSQLQQQLVNQSNNLLVAQQQSADLTKEVAAARLELAALTGKVTDASRQQAADAAQIATLQNNIAVLNVELREGDKEAARDETLLAHDRDIRNLMGARDLYIAEIYDSGKNGKTKKPFGRIFYTKNRSLIFYAYDLDQQPGVENASAFQAWGATGASDHDVSLGLFYHDSTDKKRWVLKCDDSQTIARLNAVFVTIEPKGGSTRPTGKRLLFSYLRVNPNHP